MQRGKAKDVKALVHTALNNGLTAQQILNEGLLAGMNVVGVKFKNNEVYVPDGLVAARAMKAGTEILKPLLASEKVKASGKVIIGTDVPAEKFIEAAITNQAQIICASALLTTTMGEFTPIIEAAKAAGIRDKIVIMVGGAPVTEAFAKSVGADLYAPDAASAAEAAVAAL
jgi:methanogenic corrinoid protein MtbC1